METRSQRNSRSAPCTFTVGGKFSKSKSTQEEVTGELFASDPSNLGLMMAYGTFIGAAVILTLVHIFGQGPRPPERRGCNVTAVGDHAKLDIHCE